MPHNMPHLPCTRLYPFLVPYSSHPIHCPHPHVRSSSLPVSRHPSFINWTRSNCQWPSGVSATIIDRAISAISTIKIFNAVPYETSRAITAAISFDNLKPADELTLNNVLYAYPSQPTLTVLKDVSLFLPANETMFIVGFSGSGKSTIAQLIMRMYNQTVL